VKTWAAYNRLGSTHGRAPRGQRGEVVDVHAGIAGGGHVLFPVVDEADPLRR
jgi:hypothetical protein